MRKKDLCQKQDFRDTCDRLKEEYLDWYEGVKSEVLSTNRFNENSDLSSTFLGRVNVARKIRLLQKRNFHYQSKGTQQENYWMVPNV